LASKITQSDLLATSIDSGSENSSGTIDGFVVWP
jgi:hypothetical protein